MRLSIPYPVSANRYWRSYVPRGHNRAIVVLSEEAKSYKSEVGWLAKAWEAFKRAMGNDGYIVEYDSVIGIIDAMIAELLRD